MHALPPLEAGPVGCVLCPSRELARQSAEVIAFFLARLKRSPLRSCLFIGGEQKGPQLDALQRRGVHAGVGRDRVQRHFNMPSTAVSGSEKLSETSVCRKWEGLKLSHPRVPVQKMGL